MANLSATHDAMPNIGAEPRERPHGLGTASKQESVATKIRDLIIDGELPSGMHLMEVPLAERLGVLADERVDKLTESSAS